jgi:formylglycine-generating enzyme required for sulfatase activity
MAGNAFEWTSSVVTAQNGAEAGKQVNAVRGGSWYSTGRSCQTSYRGEGRAASGGYNTVGFRVAAVKA